MRTLNIGLNQLEPLKDHLLNEEKRLRGWENLAIKATNYALMVLLAAAIVNVAYFAVPLIPFAITLGVSLLMTYFLRLRIVRENFSSMAAGKLIKWIYSPTSLKAALKINGIVLLMTLPFAVGGFFGYRIFSNKVNHFTPLKLALAGFQIKPTIHLPESVCEELEALASKYCAEKNK